MERIETKNLVLVLAFPEYILLSSNLLLQKYLAGANVSDFFD